MNPIRIGSAELWLGDCVVLAHRWITEAQRQADLFIRPVEEDKAYPPQQWELLDE